MANEPIFVQTVVPSGRPGRNTLRAIAFGMAATHIWPNHIEVKVHENGTSLELTPWKIDKEDGVPRTNMVLQMDRTCALEVAAALKTLAEILPETV